MKQFQKFLTLDRTMSFLVGAIFAILLNVISNLITDQGILILIMSVIMLIGAIIIIIRSPQRVEATISAPIPLYTNGEFKRSARQGLIAFVPHYFPPRGQDESKINYHQQAIEKEMSAFIFQGSNFETLVEAITCHSSALKHCWLIGTSGKNGSNVFIPVLIEYLKQKNLIDDEIEFHYGEEFEIDIAKDDSAIVGKIRQMVNGIFSQAEGLGVPDRQMIADITNGPRAMSFGMILACVDESRDIQHMGTKYDEFGKATGKPVPIIFHFEIRQVT